MTLIFILNSTPFVRYIMEETKIGDEKRWSWRFHYHPSAMTKEDLIDCRERKGYATANNRYDLSVCSESNITSVSITREYDFWSIRLSLRNL